MTASRRNRSRSRRVLLASASAIRRAGLETLLKAAPSLKLVASLANPQAIFHRAAELRPDVALVDLERESSLAFSASFSFSVVALIDDPHPSWTAEALRSGVKAILPRDAGAKEIQSAIRVTLLGMVVLSADVSLHLAETIRSPSQKTELPFEELTPRELEVLALLSEGLGNRQVADRLGISGHTIKFYISSILDKLGASTRTEAVTTALRMGLILL